MPIRVELVVDAAGDVRRYAESGNLALFLKKLIRLEDVGEAAGQPLGGPLTGWRKIVVGDRDWRIIFSVDPEKTTATVLVVGDRSDAECYEEAHRRLDRLGENPSQAKSLAAVIFELSEMQRASKRTKRRK